MPSGVGFYEHVLDERRMRSLALPWLNARIGGDLDKHPPNRGYPSTMTGKRTSLRLRVVPGARRPGIVGRQGDAWKVRVAAAPEAGKANDAVLDLLARTLDLARRDLELTAGRSSRDKVVIVEGVTSQAAESMLEAAAERDR